MTGLIMILLCQLHKLTCDKLVLEGQLGRIQTTPVNIGGTRWKPQFPIESQIKEELEELLNQFEKNKNRDSHRNYAMDHETSDVY